MEWRPVIGYEGVYEVSDEGTVRSLDRLDSRGWRRKGRPLRARSTATGHRSVALCRANVDTSRLIHRLVLEAFVGPCPPGMEARHLNGDPADNRLANLRWGTRSENQRDRVRLRENPHSAKTHCANGHPLSGDNLYVPPGRPTWRKCRTCTRENMRRYRKEG